MCMMSFVEDPVSIFFCGFNHKRTQKFQKTMPSVSSFIWLLVLSNVLSEIWPRENYVKPKTSSQCQRILRKKSSVKRQHCAHGQALLNHQVVLAIFLPLAQTPEATSGNGVTVLLMPIPAILQLSTLYMMSTIICQGISF